MLRFLLGGLVPPFCLWLPPCRFRGAFCISKFTKNERQIELICPIAQQIKSNPNHSIWKRRWCNSSRGAKQIYRWSVDACQGCCEPRSELGTQGWGVAGGLRCPFFDHLSKAVTAILDCDDGQPMRWPLVGSGGFFFAHTQRCA